MPAAPSAVRYALPLLAALSVACARRLPVPEPLAMPLELRYPIVPRPAALRPAAGEFAIGPSTRIVVDGDAGEDVRRAVDRWADRIRRASGLPLPVTRATTSDGAGAIVVALDPAAGTAAEAYLLDVAPRGVRLSAPAFAGIVHGLETLRQLLPPAIERPAAAPTALNIPAVRIEDAPRFVYRGMHLDVGRHFFPVDFIKRYIDLLALYKFNTFHWHLTEDQGWRIEIRKYPRLTSVGGWRRETILERNFDPYIGDGRPYGGFYTQDEVRDVVAYAAERAITVIPEIEMPGHSLAALAAYPELACTDGPFEVGTRWGVFDDIYCPSERTFEFLQDVLTEVMALFPSRYIHIGGDEAPKRRWRESAVAQEVIRREGLADEEELQSWFIRRIERFLAGHGRRLIGWDEILEGGLAPDATVMSWRGVEGGIEAARQGHDVIMTPTSHAYFDYYQGPRAAEPLAIGGFTPLDKVYAFEPVPPELTAEEARHVLGAQGNVWTEYMKTSDHVEYMAVPRMLALAEVVWSPREARDYDGFLRRAARQLERLDALGVRYRPLDAAPPRGPGAH
jgi:hexosaminidase